ncbi:MAG: gliding motility protein GldN [Bacteroidota bacterium]|nr:gliding motility protein GldN [Bacteroidota bacterium]
MNKRNHFKIIFIGLVLFFIVGPKTVFSQSSYEDFTYYKSAVKERQVIPYRFIREGNIKYAKRIHRIIDTREKQNKVMHWPRNPLHKIIYEAVMDGEVKAYKSDSLSSFYTPEEVAERGIVKENTTIQDPLYPDDPDMVIDTTIDIPFESKYITKYRIMEDWLFDYNYGDFRARIIAIAPLYRPVVGGVELGDQPLFYAKLDDLRPIFVNQELFNRFNDAARISFDDFFQMRMFSSYIVKQSNQDDIDLKYMEQFEEDGVRLLLESDRIKNQLFILEHDLWEY